MWSWRDTRDVGLGEFGLWFFSVVPLTSCTVWFWVAANKNLEQLGEEPLFFQGTGGIWAAPLVLGLATGACLWTLYTDSDSLTPTVGLVALLVLILVVAAVLLPHPQGSWAVWLGISFAGVIVSTMTSLSLATY